ncbi:PREDICTED: pentatricopeptide repeat-containing protein At4g30700-like isoform X2 [Ipomoea nil]|uniref:pentatricopeptide repeat-containing protein At4g30700-like isoform X2 n=1 Tax=Ipomoea nil TaxID=35883 RepID=UPI0009015CA6|nr:PREDICTED: pentatricopeptide repeat-containing protein At4g30700-like isoform X2 [Ipomoea nil]
MLKNENDMCAFSPGRLIVSRYKLFEMKLLSHVVKFPSILENRCLAHMKPLLTLSVSSFSNHSSVLDTHHFLPPQTVSNGLLLSLLQQFSKDIFWVTSIHAQIVVNSLSTDQFLATMLVKAYAELGSLETARYVFDQFTKPEVFLCNAMMNGFLKWGQYCKVVELFRMMGTLDLRIDGCTCTFTLKACSALPDYETGMEIVRRGLDCGMQNDRFFGSSMLSFLVKFDHIDDAQRLFDKMGSKDVVCWNSMMGGYVRTSQFNKVFRLFFVMRRCNIRPSTVTMVNLIQACEGMGCIRIGQCGHGLVVELGMGNDVTVLTSLINMYNKMGDLESSSLVFNRMPTRTLVSWNVMISGCVQNNLVHKSLEYFHELVCHGIAFDSGTLVSLLQGCSQVADLGGGKILHACILRRSLDSNDILSTVLVDLYAKCGELDKANYVFTPMKGKNVITWTALLVGLAQNGKAEDALKLFHQMQEEKVVANSVTLVALVYCCAHLGSLKKGKSVHANLLRLGFCFDVVNMTALIDMYAKCGKLSLAERVFNTVSNSGDVILWNSMITGYGVHGFGHQALSMYDQMMRQGVAPNQTTFVALLAACSHSGLVEEGIDLFEKMKREHNMKPSEKHYACFVDLLSRAGRLKDAEAFIRKMPSEPGTAVLEALLNGCRYHKNIDIGLRTADKLLHLDSTNPGDDSHPNWQEIHKFLEALKSEIEACGYVPDTSCVLRDVDEKMKVKLLWGHSERSAIAFGLLSTPAGSVIRLTKNLRVCNDCHMVTKYISQIVQREIIVRDVNRFHHFRNGKCSCGDYW